MANAWITVGKFLIEEYGDDAIRVLKSRYAADGATDEEQAELQKGIEEALRQLQRDPADFFGPRIGAKPGEPVRPSESDPEPAYGGVISFGHEPSDVELHANGYAAGDRLLRHWQVESSYVVLNARSGTPADTRWIFVRTIG